MKQGEWIGIADMMSGLMMVFMFLAVAYMLEVKDEQETIRDIAVTYKRTQLELHKSLRLEFAKDLEKWQAEIRDDNSVVFYAPEVLFQSGSSEITARFRSILDDFFPRYVRILRIYRHNVDEVRIEGHTSEDWKGAEDDRSRYLNNMRLSQERALSVLDYCYDQTARAYKKWYTRVVHANGMAFSAPIFTEQGAIDEARSRRVEFRAITRAAGRIERILQRIQGIDR